MRVRVLLPAVLALTLAACAGAPVELKVRPEARALRPRAVAVYPYQFRWDAAPWRVYEQARTVVQAALEDGRFLVVGPRELKVLRPDLDRPLAGSTVGSTLADSGLRPEEAVVLRVWAEARVASASKAAFDARGRTLGQVRSERRTYVVHAQVLQVYPGRVVLEASTRVEVDPFAPVPDWDPLAPLTRATRALTKRVLSELKPAAAPHPPLGAVLVPNAAQAFRSPSGPGTSLALERLDLLEREAVELSVFRFFDPELPPARVRTYRHEPGGAMVLSVEGDAAELSGLKAGDLVVRCADAQVTGPETVLRHLAVHGADGVPLTVLRDGRPQRLLLRTP